MRNEHKIGQINSRHEQSSLYWRLFPVLAHAFLISLIVGLLEHLLRFKQAFGSGDGTTVQAGHPICIILNEGESWYSDE